MTASPRTLPPAGHVAVYGGEEYATAPTAERDGLYLFPRPEQVPLLSGRADVVRRSPPGAARPFVVVPLGAVERLLTRTIRAVWFGLDVGVLPQDATTAVIHHDRDPGLARAMGMQGSQHEGFQLTVPVAELTEIQVLESPYDYPHRRQG